MEAAERRNALRGGGFSDEQANALAFVMSDLPTRDELDATRDHLDGRVSQLQRDIRDLQTRVEERFLQVHRDMAGMWWKLTLLLLAQAGLVASLVKLL